MKYIQNSRIIIGAIIVLFSSCRKEDTNNNGNDLPTVINTIVSQAIIDSLSNWGMTINKGTTPTSIEGIYFLSKNLCTFDNSGNNTAGRVFDDYKIKFINQNNSAFTVSVGANDVAHLGTDSSFASTATYISGKDSLFTVFSLQTGVASGVKDTTLFVYSGAFTTTGIKNLQLAIYLKGKGGDANNTVLIKVGSCRIFKDNDGLSELSKNYNTDSPQEIVVPLKPETSKSDNITLFSTF